MKIFWYAVNYPDIRLFVELCGCLFLCCELCSGNIGAISITSFLNSTLIKTFGDLSYENSSTVNPVQATLSSHLKISKTRGFQMMFRRNVDLEWINIWSSVSGRHKQWDIFWQLIFISFAKYVNLLQQSFTNLSKLLLFRYISATSFWRKRLK